MSSFLLWQVDPRNERPNQAQERLMLRALPLLDGGIRLCRHQSSGPPEGAFASCLINTRPVTASCARNHRSPLALL